MNVVTLTDSEIETLWGKGNNAGDGYAVGEQTMTPWEAAEAEEFTDIRSFNTSTSKDTCVIGRDGDKWVAICDCNGPWAVDISGGPTNQGASPGRKKGATHESNDETRAQVAEVRRLR